MEVMRYARVMYLESGLTATASKRGHVDWAEMDAALDDLNIVNGLLLRGDRFGYSKPGYALYAPASIIGGIDAVKRVVLVAEDAWHPSLFHTIPFEVTA